MGIQVDIVVDLLTKRPKVCYIGSPKISFVACRSSSAYRAPSPTRDHKVSVMKDLCDDLIMGCREAMAREEREVIWDGNGLAYLLTP